MIGQDVIKRFEAILGSQGVITERGDIEPWIVDWRGRFFGDTPAILAPKSTQEVADAISLANSLSVRLVPQGGNTSMVGGATPPADNSTLILSLRRMNQIRNISAEDNIAICEAGVILSILHEKSAEIGRRFPLSLGAKGSATIGGLVSTNAGGTQVLRHGTMRALVEGLEAVLPDGSIFDCLANLKKDNRGYDIKQLLIGAEGTLGVITAATLKLVPAIAARAVAWIGVDSPFDALSLLRFAEQKLGNELEGFEVIANDGLQHVLEYLPGARSPIETSSAWHVLMEVDHDTIADPSPNHRLEAMLSEAFDRNMIRDAAIAASEAQAEAFWRIRESLSAAEKAQGPALQFDVSVPVAKMPQFMLETAKAAEQHFAGTTASSFGHLGDGNVHFHVRAPKGTKNGQKWIAEKGQAITMFVHDAVVSAGGSISAEHGIGQMKRAELGRLTGPAQLHALCAIKAAFDPKGLFNPDKLIPHLDEV